ncbi:thiamine-phosphate kinase [Natronobacterium gregoryi]|uniref:Thiamine-monophosphate kinase n=2 Tax=Natronobacterium gregoryi TaxID=44930 RepID=L0AII1_NATGS|nr:thiamine-phosphate kinase [Natronobacterium gregoryi]AFZ73591.1 thiamine-monophosphate kinase [Natronobacterium gregoryi SP2]ELY68153.1 thiamine-monophosphate kinase [Natronobacterium gregoryi SP2]PLK20022.1 thiamine-phosphate kinase [Natronobacterium gregoryi SP2]SFJ34815.1 thiamine-phosphate kinase [Natronobacterium gregoryi]
MDERGALALLETELEAVGDDAAVIDSLVVTTDMLHDRTDFPDGTARYTAGWRSVGASLSDVAAMGAEATAAVAAYAAPTFDREELLEFVRGASDVCEIVGAEYVGGDLDEHQEFTVTTTAIGSADETVARSGARPGDLVCVTGTLGDSAAGLELFQRAADGGPNADAVLERANDLFQFQPRVAAGRALAPHATAMMDSSDGLARSLHQLAAASDCGFAIESDEIPIDDTLLEVAADDAKALELATTFGEDFELVATVPSESLEAVRDATDVPLSIVGTVLECNDGITLDGETLADAGYTHG